MRARISASKIFKFAIDAIENFAYSENIWKYKFPLKIWSLLFWSCKYREAWEEAGESGASARRVVGLDKGANTLPRKSTRLGFRPANLAIQDSSVDKASASGRNGGHAALMTPLVPVKLASETASTAQKVDQSKLKKIVKLRVSKIIWWRFDKQCLISTNLSTSISFIALDTILYHLDTIFLHFLQEHVPKTSIWNTIRAWNWAQLVCD